VNLSSRASYRHGGRGPLTTDLVKTPLIKALIGDVIGLGLKPTLGIEINPTSSPLISIDEKPSGSFLDLIVMSH
jgi:hypothetical protein